MKIAIVGGGASGLMTAWLLEGVHRVVLFERQPVLGGNIRTLNRNVQVDWLADDLTLEAGVVEFDRGKFPLFHRLLARLGVDVRDVPVTTALRLRDGRLFRSPANIRRSDPGWWEGARAWLRLIGLAPDRQRFFRRAGRTAPAELYRLPLSAFADDRPFGIWLKTLMMYAYSIPTEALDQLPAALAVPVLRDFLQDTRWTMIPGGVYRYVERMVETMSAEIRLEVEIKAIQRGGEGVDITWSGGRERFDAVVFATPPDQVLQLLADPTPQEQHRFGAWRANRIETVIHTDSALYDRLGIPYRSEFDLFDTTPGRYGYNACLERLCDTPGHPPHRYSLAFQMDPLIRPDQVVHRQPHHTPAYTREAFQHREAVRATNGENHTFHAGAWLGNGLHEGALTAALAVSQRLGGRQL